MTQYINLLERKSPEQTSDGTARLALIGLVLVGVALGAMGWTQWRTLNEARAELARTLAESERLRVAQNSIAGSSSTFLAQLDQQEREVAALESVAVQLTSGKLGRTRGFTEELRAFGRATAPGIWYTGINLDNTTDAMALEGRAIDATRLPALVHALASEAHFAGTRFDSVELKAGEADGAGKPRDLAFRIVTPARLVLADTGKTGGIPTPGAAK